MRRNVLLHFGKSLVESGGREGNFLLGGVGDGAGGVRAGGGFVSGGYDPFGDAEEAGK